MENWYKAETILHIIAGQKNPTQQPKQTSGSICNWVIYRVMKIRQKTQIEHKYLVSQSSRDDSSFPPVLWAFFPSWPLASGAYKPSGRKGGRSLQIRWEGGTEQVVVPVLPTLLLNTAFSLYYQWPQTFSSLQRGNSIFHGKLPPWFIKAATLVH